MFNVPADRVVPPVYVLAPPRKTVPAPALTRLKALLLSETVPVSERVPTAEKVVAEAIVMLGLTVTVTDATVCVIELKVNDPAPARITGDAVLVFRNEIEPTVSLPVT